MLSLQGDRYLPRLQRHGTAGAAKGEAMHLLLPARQRKVRELPRAGNPGPVRPSHSAPSSGTRVIWEGQSPVSLFIEFW